MTEPSLSPPDSPVQVLPRELTEFQQIYGEFLNDQELLELYETTREQREGYAIEEKPAREAPPSSDALPPGLILSPEQRDFYSRYRGPITAQDVRNLQHETAMIRAMIKQQEASGHDSPPLGSPSRASPQQLASLQHGFPQQGSPQHGSPQQASPQGSPQQASSQQGSPQHGSPQQVSPQGSPQQASSQHGSPQGSPQQHGFLQQGSSQHGSPQGSPQQPGFLQQGSSQHGSPQEASPQGSPQQGSPQQGTPQHGSPQEASPQGSPQQGPSQHASYQQAASSQGSPQGESPQQAASPQGSTPPQAPPSPGSLHENLGAITIREAVGLPAETLLDTFRIAMRRASSSSGDESSDDSDASSENSVDQAHDLLWDLIWRLCSYALFMLIFGTKEIVYSFCAYVDMLCLSPIANFFLYLLKQRGFYQDRNYINSRRLFLVHGVQTSSRRMFMRVAALWVGFAFLLVYMAAPDKKPLKPGRPAEVDLMSIYGATTSTMQASTSSERFESDVWKRALETTYVDESEDIDWKTRLRSWLPISDLSPRGIVCSVCNRFCGQSKAMLPDHALKFSGSQVLYELTSPTFGGGNKNATPPIFMQRVTISGMPSPVAAITDYQHPGTCWPMAGKQGSLGVRLRRPVSVKAVSIDYMDYPHVITSKSAPADFEVWGLTHKGNRFWKYPWDSLASLKEDDGKVYLGKFKYDINKASRVQTFNIQAKSPPIKDIVFRFLDNWGHEDYTCIYRVRVHGVVV